MNQKEKCPQCGAEVAVYRNPFPTVDMIICNDQQEIILVRRKNPPFGWALPGGFVDYGETVEQAAVREAKEETSLDVDILYLLGVYSDPNRDPRKHTMSTVFVGKASEIANLKGADDALEARFFPLDALPEPLAFDHGKIIQDFCRTLSGECQTCYALRQQG